MEVIRVLIIHRQATLRTRLRGLLEDQEDLDLAGELADTTNAVPFIRECQPHLVFLDPPLEDDGVVQKLHRISEALPPLIVFVSACDDYAVRAFEASALDYLHEPFSDARFHQTLARARGRLREHRIIAHSDRLFHLLQNFLKARADAAGVTTPAPHHDRLVVKSGNRLIFLDVEEVDWIESEGVYVRLHVGGKTYLLRESLQNVEERLHARQFLRIHRSTIVNLRRIKEIVPNANGGAVVILRTGNRLRLSRSYRNRLNATLG